MKTKLLLSLLLLCAAGAAAATYTSQWSAFNSGMATRQNGAVTHTGVLSAWTSPTLPPTTTPSAPVLTIILVGNQVRVSWPASAIGFELEETTALNGGIWTTIPSPYESDGSELFILAPVTPGHRFYRLHLP